MYPNSYTGSSRVTMGHIFPALFFSLLFASVGLNIGEYVPTALFLPLMVVELIMIIAATFIRRSKRVGYGFLYSFTIISGITLYPVIANYVSVIGASMVLQAFAVTVIAYGGAALYATISKSDFSFLSGFLFIGIIALLGMGIVNFFVPFSTTAAWIYTLLGILIFIGYTLFDISRITHYGVTQEEIPFVVLSLFLNFVNLFLFILRLFGLNLKRD
ncbi:Bax inhibitor-1/YccA family protein [Paenibacillus filicis]|uniref:Bax inhibitor-1/YccA family protein n=1 Tax=Paenibacillus gyeongsangnamensis TaxID=3388067 RepID=A0ABT4QLD2_9BACL|nr:Bax inhibitor-1/YccA family protein [Paenibacillus filicis]MCZ8517682.1 Bax inhibitor-1/YccA family protein [Paenibacillus filicis]